MVVSCSAYGCTNRFSKERKLQFHRFPLDNPELLKKWIIAMRRAEWQPTKYTRLCSDHFTVESYKSAAKCYLNNEAVPSIFNFPTQLKKNVQEQTVLIEPDLPQQQCESLQIALDPNICDFVQNHVEDSPDENENEHQNITQTDTVNPLSSLDCNLEHIPDNLNCSNENKELLHTQNGTVFMPSSPSHATTVQTHASCSEAKISPNNAGCYGVLMVPSSKHEESGPTKQQLRKKIKSLQEKIRRRDMKIKGLETVIKRLETVTARPKKVAKKRYKTVPVKPKPVGSIPVQFVVDELKNSGVNIQGQSNSCQFILKGSLWQSSAKRKIIKRKNKTK